MNTEKNIIKNNTTIILKSMLTTMSIGAHNFEKESQQKIEIDISIEMNQDYNVLNDELKDAFNYDTVYDIVKKHTLKHKHINLQESLVNLISNDIIQLDNRIRKVIVYSKKLEIYKDCESIGIKTELERE